MNVHNTRSATGFPTRMSRAGRAALDDADDAQCLEESAVLCVPLHASQVSLALSDSNEDLVPRHRGVALRDACVPANDGVQITPQNNRVYIRSGVTLPTDVPADVRIDVSQRGGPNDVYTAVLPPRLATVLSITNNSGDGTLDVQLTPWASAPDVVAMMKEWTARVGPLHLHGVINDRTLLLDYNRNVTPVNANTLRVDLSDMDVMAPNGVVEVFGTPNTAVDSTAASSAALSTGVLQSDADLAAVLTAGLSTPHRRVRVLFAQGAGHFEVRVSRAAHDVDAVARVSVTGTVTNQLLQLHNARPHVARDGTTVFTGQPRRAGAREYITLPTGTLQSTGDVVTALQAAFDAQRTLNIPQPALPPSVGHSQWNATTTGIDVLQFDVTLQTDISTVATGTVSIIGGAVTPDELVEQVQAQLSTGPFSSAPIQVAVARDGHGVSFTCTVGGNLTLDFSGSDPGVAGALGYQPADAVITSPTGVIQPNAETLHVWQNAVTHEPLQAAFTVSQHTTGGALLVAAHTAYPTVATSTTTGPVGVAFQTKTLRCDAGGTLTGAVPGTRVVFDDSNSNLRAGVVLRVRENRSLVDIVMYGNYQSGVTELSSVERVPFSIQTDPDAPHAAPLSALGIHTTPAQAAASTTTYGIGAALPLGDTQQAPSANGAALTAVSGEVRVPSPPALYPAPFLYLELKLAGQVVGDVVRADAPPHEPRARMLAVLSYDSARHAYVSPGVNAYKDYFSTPRGSAQHLVVRLLDNAAQAYHPHRGAGVAVLDLL